MPTDTFEQIFAPFSDSERALFELVLPLNKQMKSVKDRELDRGRHNARRTRWSAEAKHPFELEVSLSPDELYKRVDPKAREMFEKMPGVKDENDKRERVTRGVVFWQEYYEHKCKAEQEHERRTWEHRQKIKALEKKRAQLEQQATKEFVQELEEATNVLAEERGKAASKRANEQKKYPEWYEAADALDELLGDSTEHSAGSEAAYKFGED